LVYRNITPLRGTLPFSNRLGHSVSNQTNFRNFPWNFLFDFLWTRQDKICL